MRRLHLLERNTWMMNEPDSEDKPGFSPPLRRLAYVKEACVYGKISETELYELLNDGTIKAYKRRTTTLVNLNTIDAFNESLPPYVPRANGAKTDKKNETLPQKDIKVETR
jgi:excisionase family DNA binding protein